MYSILYFVTIDVPNAGQKLVTLPKRLKWNEVFKDYVKGLDKKKPVIICGDLNVAHQEIGRLFFYLFIFLQIFINYIN